MNNKAIQVVLSVLVVVLAITSFFKWTPSSYVMNWYLNFFETDRYSVLLITFIQVFPLLLLWIAFVSLRTMLRRIKSK